jgi:hypothetical protein
MLHPNRVFNIAPVARAAALAERLTERAWTLCTGFHRGDLLFLNDSISENSAAEYAVIHNGRQIESVTFGWCAQVRAGDHRGNACWLGVPLLAGQY